MRIFFSVTYSYTSRGNKKTLPIYFPQDYFSCNLKVLNQRWYKNFKDKVVKWLILAHFPMIIGRENAFCHSQERGKSKNLTSRKTQYKHEPSLNLTTVFFLTTFPKRSYNCHSNEATHKRYYQLHKQILPWTMMLKLQSLVLLLKSETMQLTSVVPTGKLVPESWLQSAVGFSSTLSIISIEKCTTAAFDPVSVVVVVPVGHFGTSVSRVTMNSDKLPKSENNSWSNRKTKVVGR